MRPYLARVRGRHIVPRPLKLSDLGLRLGCSLTDVRTLLDAGRFPHAYIDWEGEWRVPFRDVDTYIRLRNSSVA